MKDQSSKVVLTQGQLEQGLYKLNNSLSHCFPFKAQTSSVAFLHASTFLSQNTKSNLWHERLWHPSFRVLSQIRKHTSLQISSRFCIPVQFYNSCQLAKSHKLPFVNSNSRAIKPLDLVHSDLWGASPILYVTSVRCFHLIIDDL